MVMGNRYIKRASGEASDENDVDTVDSHKETHSRNVDRYQTTAEFTTRITVKDDVSQDVNPTTWTYLYTTNMSAEKGVTVTKLTIVIFIDEWHPVTQESTKDVH